jgi:chemotaxis protein methyltransferase CheR
VESEETRQHLQDTHNRVLSIAAVQRQLHAAGLKGTVELVPYLTNLCEAISRSMIADDRPILVKVVGGQGNATSRQAESLGLIATELVMNALKHAFPDDKTEGRIIVGYEISGTDWKLSVSDNGVGRPDGVFAQPKAGLGTGIVKALAKQLDAQVITASAPRGTRVTVTHSTFSPDPVLQQHEEKPGV